MKCPVVSFEVSMGLVWLLTTCILMLRCSGYVPVLLENYLGMSCSETCWLLGGACFQCKYRGVLDELLSTNVP